MKEVKLNNSNENPFFGCRKCLDLFQKTDKNITTLMLDDAFNEVKNSKEKREMFYSLLFSIGDITSRQHNIFKGVKKDNGGNANREGFYTVFMWLRDNHYEQFLKFLNAGLFNEYTCFDLLFRSRIKTKGNKVIQVYDVFADNKYRKDLGDYIYKILHSNNPFDKQLVAKFLSLPRLSKRSGHKRMLYETSSVMLNKVKFLTYLSNLMGWDYSLTATKPNFVGYRRWRKQYNGDFESVLFSTGKINEFNKESFLLWLDKLPSQARFRVKNRVLYSVINKGEDNSPLKYPKLKEWFTEWESVKEEKQQEQRVLEEKVRQNQATEEDLNRLKKVKKEAKVTTGAVNFKDLYEDIKAGRVDKLKLQSFVDKVNLPYNSLVIVDDSGSMWGEPYQFAAFMAAVCLYKNPDDDARNLLGFFNSQSRLVGYIDQTASDSKNSIMRTTAVKIRKRPLIDPHKSFYDNYKEIHNYCKAVFNGGWTHIDSIPEGFKKQCDKNPEFLDALKNYPVWTIISDGEWNNESNPKRSMEVFMDKCESYFGYRPFIMAVDVFPNGYVERYGVDASHFEGIDNFIYIPSNPAQIEQFLTNFKDMDIFDVYTPLQSLYRSNRYELIRINTLLF